ncbi:MAG: hypothetical protein QXJ19_04385 [Candidatus Bathyarchaeia archaeon]
MRNKKNMYKEPRSNVTSWHAYELCRGCGSCILFGKRSKYCPGKLRLNQLTLPDDLTWSPARNIISFTGGDLACNPELNKNLLFGKYLETYRYINVKTF